MYGKPFSHLIKINQYVISICTYLQTTGHILKYLHICKIFSHIINECRHIIEAFTHIINVFLLIINPFIHM